MDNLNDPKDSIVDLVETFASLSGSITFTDNLVSSTADTATYGGVSMSIEQFSLAGVVSPTQSLVSNDTFGFDQLASLTADLPPDGILRDRVNFLLRDSSGSVFSDLGFPTSLDLADFNTPVLIFTSSANDGTRGFAA